MKTKQAKDEQDKSIDEEIIEPKTRARKKASDVNDEDKTKTSHDEPKTSKDTKKQPPKPRAVIKKRPLGIRKALRSKKTALVKEKVKTIIKQKGKRGRKPAIKADPDSSPKDKEAVPLIPASEIKREPLDETTPSSRSSSPKTAGRRQRVGSDMAMMKTMLSDSQSTLVLGSRTSPYPMRSERSNSPSLFEAKNLRSGKPRKVKNNLLNEVVMKEQKKRRRLLSDSKNPEGADEEDPKKLKRGRSCSRDGSEVSKCSDNTESDLSMNETLNDSDNRELNKKLDKSKTDLDIDIENNIQISTIEKVPSLNVDSKLAEPKPDAETSSIINEKNKKPSLSFKRSTSLDADNNNSNRLKLQTLNSSDIEDKQMLKTENDTLFEASSILTSMSKTFNSKHVTKNMKRARRGRKAAVAGARKLSTTTPSSQLPKTTSTPILSDMLDDKHDSIETLSKDILDLIVNLDDDIKGDQEQQASEAAITNETAPSIPDQMETKSVSKFYGLSKPLCNVDDNKVITPETPVKIKESVTPMSNEVTPSKIDDSENIRLHYGNSVEKVDGSRNEVITYNCSIDKLMDRLKEFEEFDKKRQRLESESKTGDSKPMMVTNDVVLIPKSGADIKPLKDIQSVRSPEKPIEKENVLSCLENNSAISIVKRDQVRKSLDLDLPNSVTLIKRNSFSARKESTSSNHSRESDAISIFEKSFGKDVTLTEIRKSDKSSTSATPVAVDLHQFATLHPTSQIGGVMLDSSQISITPRVSEPKIGSGSNDVQIITKRKSRESLTQKSPESSTETEDKPMTLEKIKSPLPLSPAVSITPAPVAIKSLETTPLEAEALPTPEEKINLVSEEIPAASKTPIQETPDVKPEDKVEDVIKVEESPVEAKLKPYAIEFTVKEIPVPEKMEVETPVTSATSVSSENKVKMTPEPIEPAVAEEVKQESDPLPEEKAPIESKSEQVKPKGPGRPPKSARTSIESQAGPSNVLMETPESQKHKESVLRTLGLLTHKAAKEAKIEKLKEKERIYSGMMSNKGKAKSSGDYYTGTLKTVIKLNRSGGDREKKKHRSSLKMTFQKSKYRSGKQLAAAGEAAAQDGTPFYRTTFCIERREGGGAHASEGGQRKSHYSNRLNHEEAVPEPAETKETLNLVIPEKASSFSIHPGRLCQDQCFYCGGKFGLFDTPCHIAQIKSSERQKKVLDNEEKLTIDSCLCDACYRHVDRRANCPSYRKRPLAKTDHAHHTPPHTTAPGCEKPASPPEEESEEEGGAARGALCHTEGCLARADKAIRRKWLIKMRTSVSRLLSLKSDYPGLHTIPLCGAHHSLLAPLMLCVLCRRRLTKHHNLHFIHHGYTQLNPLLQCARIPVQFMSRPVLCKGCRYYCSLLSRPGHNDGYRILYTNKLLTIHNVELPETGPNVDATEDPTNKSKKKQRNKSKLRKSTEPESNGSECSERTNDSTPEKKEIEQETKQPMEEDIESLISSNKIPVPNAKPAEAPSDGSENDYDFETPLLPIDKQTELQYLLQKQNNPAQFMHGQPNLTQKQKNILKLHSISGVQKVGFQQRIAEKNTRKLQKVGAMLAKDKMQQREEMEILEDKNKEVPVLQNISLNDECTIESIPNKRPADINTLKNKWQMSESFTQVKRNLSELSKKLTVEKDPTKPTEVKYSNPVKRLETNPSISVRELFPGEDEMNLQCNIEFNNVKGVTPEGWEKCNTMIQYDTETKRLWTELQRPYGNQSSFLRHLILLEKYFRSGDLVLSPTAAPSAICYSDSVQNRLRGYDSTRKEPSSLIDFRKKPSLNGKSLLKSNQGEEQDPKRFMPPPAPKPKGKEKGKSKQLPPELIAINTPNAQGRKAIQNVLHNIQQLVKGVSASDPTEVAAAPLPPPKFEAPVPSPMPKDKKDPPKDKKDAPKPDAPKTKDTPKKSKSSKPWRPTLMPITQENLAKIAREPTQVAVDGRTLPSLVQVMSSGKRYHITLHDYNKMCIMRREKLQQLQDGDKKRPSIEDTIVTELQPSTMLGNGGSVTQVHSEDDKNADAPQIGANAATILKNVGLKNITIAPIPAKTTVTSALAIPVMTSPLLVATPLKLSQLSSSVTITSETVPSPMTSQMVMPKIPKSLTVIPQTVVSNVPQNIVVSGTAPVLQTDRP